MNHQMFADYLQLYQGWSRTLTSMAWDQWRLLTSQYQAGIGALDNMLAALGGKGAASAEVPASADPQPAIRTPPAEAPAPAEALERVALLCVSKGLPPPREVYQVQNRDRINWSLFPEWARPSDPELFGECPHEG